MRVLSVDWDYFFTDLAWMDWGHSESPLLTHFIWTVRAGDRHLKTQQSALEYVQPRAAEMEVFWRRVLDPARRPHVLVAESHLELWRWLEAQIFPVQELVNFDAHHDCGYGGANEAVDCGNWVRALLDPQERRLAQYTLRYPCWRRGALTEQGWANVKRRTGVRAVFGWPRRPSRYDVVFVCRSGAWTPSWCDAQFFQFLEPLRARSCSWLQLGELAPRTPTMSQALILRDQFRAQRQQFESRAMQYQQQGAQLPDRMGSPRRRRKV
jgi:hypothetical protein